LVLGPGAGAEQADAVARRLRQRIRSARLATHEGKTIKFTASLGVVVARSDEDLDHLLGRADAALYQAKQCGRDRIWTVAGASD